MSSSSRRVLALATFTQFAAGFGFWSFGILAPELARETGLNERDFGLAVTFIFVGTLFSSLMTGELVRRFGGQATMIRLFAVMAGAVFLLFGGTWTTAMISAALFGLGYGPQGAIGMTLVTQSADRGRRGLYLAIRHASVPLAAASVGRLLPPLMVMAGWQAGVFVVLGVLALAFLLVCTASRALAVETTVAEPMRLTQRLGTVFQIPPNLRFLWMVGFAFAMSQTAVTTFSYLYLLEVVGLSAVAAGVFVSNLHLTALLGRPVLGVVTDRTGRPMLVLAGIAVIAVLALIALLQVDAETPSWVLIPVAIGCGIAGQCWNSVFVTAMSFKVAPGDLAELNGRAFAVLSVGWMISPPIVWFLIEVTGAYTVPLVGVAALNAMAALVILANRAEDRGAR